MQGITPLDLGVGPPPISGPVAAGIEQSMPDGEEDRPLDVAPEAAPLEEWLDGALAPGLWPAALEAEGRSDAPGGEGGELALGVSGEEEDGLSQRTPRPAGRRVVRTAGADRAAREWR